MKYIDGVFEFDRVHRSIGISAMVLDYFEAPWSFPSPRFRAWVLATKLRNAESGSNFIDHRLRESQQVILAGSGPEQWLLAGDALRSRHVIIPVLGYRVKRAASFVRVLHCHGAVAHKSQRSGDCFQAQLPTPDQSRPSPYSCAGPYICGWFQSRSDPVWSKN